MDTSFNSLDCSKSAGPDGIIGIGSLLVPLRLIFQKSFNKACLPSMWQLSTPYPEDQKTILRNTDVCLSYLFFQKY